MLDGVIIARIRVRVSEGSQDGGVIKERKVLGT